MVIVSFGLLHSRIEYQPTLFLEGRSLGHCVLELSCEFGGVDVNLDIFIYFWVLSFYRQPIIMWPVRTTQLACNLQLLLLKYLPWYIQSLSRHFSEPHNNNNNILAATLYKDEYPSFAGVAVSCQPCRHFADPPFLRYSLTAVPMPYDGCRTATPRSLQR